MNFPTVRTRPPGHRAGIGLLEVDANTTAFSANESIALMVGDASVDVGPPAQTPKGVDPNLAEP